jgi:hypothetical protein
LSSPLRPATRNISRPTASQSFMAFLRMRWMMSHSAGHEEERRAGGHDGPALEPAAGGEVAVHDHVEPEDEAEGVEQVGGGPHDLSHFHILLRVQLAEHHADAEDGGEEDGRFAEGVEAAEVEDDGW